MKFALTIISFILVMLSVPLISTKISDIISQNECQALVKEITKTEPGISSVTHVQDMHRMIQPILAKLPGDLVTTCAGNATFVDGTSTIMYFYRFVKQSDEYLFFESETVISEFRDRAMEQMLSSEEQQEHEEENAITRL